VPGGFEGFQHWPGLLDRVTGQEVDAQARFEGEMGGDEPLGDPVRVSFQDRLQVGLGEVPETAEERPEVLSRPVFNHETGHVVETGLA
jgi:hypothetical protein